MGLVTPDQVIARSEFPKVHHRIFVSPAQGSGTATMGRVVIEPGGEIPLHTHLVEDCMIVLRGRAEIHIGGKTFTAGPDMGVIVPANTVHGIRNPFDDPFEICFTWPAVNVQRFPVTQR
jgi:quercetin dioxygenase-like cupin family protein